jgi:bacterioferritin
MAGAFLSDIQTLRRRAREHIAQGAVTPGYHADRDVVLIAYLGDADPTSRRLMEEILAKEEEHADDLANLLEDLGH